MSSGDEGQAPPDNQAEAHPDDQLVGERVGGKYQVLRKLGAGGMGAVYEAEQQPLGRRVALKVIKRALTDEPMAVKRFINEARAVAQLNHGNIVTIHDFGAVDGGEPTAGKALYIAMELLEGHDLRDEILQRQRVEWRRASRIVAEVARALAEAHTRGIVHRDLKPDNVMLLTSPSDEVRLKVVDFGVAKLLPEHGGTAGMTGTGMVVGTPGYISPEQINGIGDDPRSDLYALGVMWFEMLAGFSPYDAETPVKLVLKHLTDPVPSVTRAMPGLDIPDSVEVLVRALMAKEPSERPANAILLVNSVERLLNDDAGLGPHMATEAAMPAAAIAEVANTPAALGQPSSTPVSSTPASSTPTLPTPSRGGSAASFPRPAYSTAPAPALSPSATTPETAQGLPMQVSPVADTAPLVAGQQRGCWSTGLIGCFGLTAICVLGMFSLATLGILFGDEESEGGGEEFVVETEVVPSPPEPPEPPEGVDTSAGPTGRKKATRKDAASTRKKKSKRSKSKKRDVTTSSDKGDAPSPTPPRRSRTKLTIEHPKKLKNLQAADAYTSAVQRKHNRVFHAVKKLVKREGVVRSAEILNGYYEHNLSRIHPDSRAADQLDDANEMVFEQYALVVEEAMPEMMKALGEGETDWMGLGGGSSGSAP